MGLSALQQAIKEFTQHSGHNAGVTVERTRLIELGVRRFANVLPSKPRLSDTSGPDGLSHRPGFFYGIGKQHGHRFARGKKMPPVTIYVGRTTPTDGTLAPAFDIVSGYGGQLPLAAL